MAGIQVLVETQVDLVEAADLQVDQVNNLLNQVTQVIMDTEVMDTHQDQVEAAVPVLQAVLMVVMEELFQVLNFLELTVAEELVLAVLADPVVAETLTAVALMVLEAEAEKI